MWEIYVSSRFNRSSTHIHISSHNYTKWVGRRTVRVFIGPTTVLEMLLLLLAVGSRGFEETIELMHVEMGFDIGKVDLGGFCS